MRQGELLGLHWEAVLTGALSLVLPWVAVVAAKPIGAGESGPVYTITERDVAFYRASLAAGGSSVFVSLGERFSERQLIETAEREKRIRILRHCAVAAITPDSVILDVNGNPAEIPNDRVFILIDSDATVEFQPQMEESVPSH